MNKWEKACKEYLKGCPNVHSNEQEECQSCAKDFSNHLRKLALEENYMKINTHCLSRLVNPEKCTHPKGYIKSARICGLCGEQQ